MVMMKRLKPMRNWNRKIRLDWTNTVEPKPSTTKSSASKASKSKALKLKASKALFNSKKIKVT